MLPLQYLLFYFFCKIDEIRSFVGNKKRQRGCGMLGHLS